MRLQSLALAYRSLEGAGASCPEEASYQGVRGEASCRVGEVLSSREGASGRLEESASCQGEAASCLYWLVGVAPRGELPAHLDNTTLGLQ